MISFLLGAIGWLVPGAGVVGALGVVVKILKWMGVGGAVVASPIAVIVERFASVIEWVVKGILGYLGTWLAGGLDHITKDARSFAILMAVAWGAYQVGGWGRPVPVSVSPPPAKAAPAKAGPTAKPVERGFFDEIDCLFKGGC